MISSYVVCLDRELMLAAYIFGEFKKLVTSCFKRTTTAQPMIDDILGKAGDRR